MLRMTPAADTLRPAPLAREERAEAVRTILHAHGIMTRRMGHASSAGITITYAHLSEAANGSQATALLAEHLDWDATDFADVAGTVAITTQRG